MLPNNSKQNDLYNNIKIPLSATEDEEINNISSNPEINYNDKEKKPTRNIHLIYKKSDNKKNLSKKKYADTSNSDISMLEKTSKNDTNRALIKKYEIKVEKLTNQIDDLRRKLFDEKKSKLDLQEELNYTKLEKEKMFKINNIEIEKTNERNISLEEQNKKLILKNEEIQKKLEE